jgi:hypothetical protein
MSLRPWIPGFAEMTPSFWRRQMPVNCYEIGDRIATGAKIAIFVGTWR